MRRKLAIQVVILVTVLAASGWADSPSQVLGERFELPNGLVWLFSSQRSLPLVSVNLVVKGGVLRDPPQKAGLANLTAVMLPQGSKSRSAVQIAQELDFLGAKLSSSGGDDSTSLSLTVLKKDLGPGLELFKDILYHPAFAPAELSRKLSQLKASFQNDEDDPGTVASRAFHRHLFGPHPYGHPPKGTLEGLAAIKREDLVEFHRTYYRPNNAILTLVGDLSREEAEEWVTKTFGSWQPGPIPPLKLPAPPPLKGKTPLLIDKNITQANIVWGHLGISRNNPDFYALQLLNYLLGGGGFSSRLMTRVREKQGLAYAVGSSFDAGLEPGAFVISLETKNENAREAVNQIIQEVERLRRQAVSPAELEDAKSYFIGSFPAKMDSISKRAGLLAYVEFYGLGLDYPGRYPTLIRNLTPEDLRKAAEKYLHPDNYLLVVVGRKTEVANLKALAPAPEDEEKKHEAPSSP